MIMERMPVHWRRTEKKTNLILRGEEVKEMEKELGAEEAGPPAADQGRRAQGRRKEETPWEEGGEETRASQTLTERIRRDCQKRKQEDEAGPGARGLVQSFSQEEADAMPFISGERQSYTRRKQSSEEKPVHYKSKKGQGQKFLERIYERQRTVKTASIYSLKLDT